MQCFFILFCHTRKPSQLRNTVLKPREIIPTRRNNLLQGVRSIGKLNVPPEILPTPLQDRAVCLSYHTSDKITPVQITGSDTDRQNSKVFVVFGGLQRFPMNGLLAFNWRFRASGLVHTNPDTFETTNFLAYTSSSNNNGDGYENVT